MTANIPDETRHDFYHAIHKALRLGHCRMLEALGSHNYADDGRTAALMTELRGILALGRTHLESENREIHAALEQRVPGASAHAAEDHEEHERSFREIEDLIGAVEAKSGHARERAGRALYKRYAVFAAHDLEHMNEEETELLAVLHKAFTDEELLGIEGRIVSAIPPQKMAAYMALMVPALNHGERVDLLSKLKKAMPEPVFNGLLSDTIRPSLPAKDYASCMDEVIKG